MMKIQLPHLVCNPHMHLLNRTQATVCIIRVLRSLQYQISRQQKKYRTVTTHFKRVTNSDAFLTRNVSVILSSAFTRAARLGLHFQENRVFLLKSCFKKLRISTLCKVATISLLNCHVPL